MNVGQYATSGTGKLGPFGPVVSVEVMHKVELSWHVER